MSMVCMTVLVWEPVSVSQPISPSELAELWRRQAGVLEAFAGTRCDSPEDCVQEAFIKLAAMIPPPRDPVAWLYQVVRNRSLNEVRSSVRRRNMVSKYADSQETMFDQSPDVELQRRQTNQALLTAMQSLPPELHEIVIAHVWGGLTFRQIGTAHEMSHATAHRHFQLALDELRKILQVDELRILETKHGSLF